MNKVLALEMSRRYEVCDRCGQMERATKLFFDGREFLWLECRAKNERSKGRAQAQKSQAEQAGDR